MPADRRRDATETPAPGDLARRIQEVLDTTDLSMEGLSSALAEYRVSASRRTLINYRSGATSPRPAQAEAVREALDRIAADRTGAARPGELLRLLPLYDDQPSAAGVTAAFAEGSLGVPADRLRTTRMRGDSMVECIRAGDVLIVDVKPPTVRDGAVYAYRADGAQKVRRARLDGTVGWLVPDNAAAGGPDRMDPSTIVGEVVAVLSSL